MGQVISLDEHRERRPDTWDWDPPLPDRERKVLRAIADGSDCGLCGDLGAVREHTGEGVACLCCGRLGA